MRRTQKEFLTRITNGLPPSMAFVYALGNNDLWPNNKNSAHNFQVPVSVLCGCVSISLFVHVCRVCRLQTPLRLSP